MLVTVPVTGRSQPPGGCLAVPFRSLVLSLSDLAFSRSLAFGAVSEVFALRVVSFQVLVGLVAFAVRFGTSPAGRLALSSPAFALSNPCPGASCRPLMLISPARGRVAAAIEIVGAVAG